VTVASVTLDDRDCRPGGLPPYCMKCGRPAEVAPAKWFAWLPAWVIALLVLGACGAPAFLFAALSLTQRCRVRTPLCPDHSDYWIVRAWFAYGGLAAVVGSVGGLGYVAARQKGPTPYWIAVSFAALTGAFLLWLAALKLMHVTSIHAAKITDDFVLLRVVHPHFIAALEQWRAVRPAEPPTELDELMKLCPERPKRGD
jgi:hypothetical protein